MATMIEVNWGAPDRGDVTPLVQCRPVPHVELGHISSFGRGVLQMVFGASTLTARDHGGVYQGVVLDIFHIYVVRCRGRQPLRGGECNTLAH